MSHKECKYIAQAKDYGQLSDKIIQDAYIKYESLCEENKDEPKAMDIHTKDRIYPSIAIFYALLNNGIERKDAVEFVYNYYAWRSQRMEKFIHKLLKIPFLYKVMPSIFAYLTNKMFGEAAGFKAKYYQTSKKEFKFDMIVCPYYNICKKYDCEDIVKAFCHADDICYGHMHPYVKWLRTKTIGNGDDCCDFHIVVSKEK